MVVGRFENSLSPGLITRWKTHSGFQSPIGEIPGNSMSTSNRTDPQKRKQNPRLRQSLPSYYSIKFGLNFIKGGVIVVIPVLRPCIDTGIHLELEFKVMGLNWALVCRDFSPGLLSEPYICCELSFLLIFLVFLFQSL